MKKLFTFIMCALLLICTIHVCAFAEGESVSDIETNEGAVDTLPFAEESDSESENSGTLYSIDISTEAIMEYIKSYFEEITVVISLIVTAFYNIRKHKQFNRSISVTNSNAITVSENSERVIAEALNKIEGISVNVSEYKEAFATLLDEYRASEEEKKCLQKTLDEAMSYIKNAKLANIEFAKELADLLMLANIPNSKKEELYKRHLTAVNAIDPGSKTEVNINEVGQET